MEILRYVANLPAHVRFAAGFRSVALALTLLAYNFSAWAGGLTLRLWVGVVGSIRPHRSDDGSGNDAGNQKLLNQRCTQLDQMRAEWSDFASGADWRSVAMGTLSTGFEH